MDEIRLIGMTLYQKGLEGNRREMERGLICDFFFVLWRFSWSFGDVLICSLSSRPRAGLQTVYNTGHG